MSTTSRSNWAAGIRTTLLLASMGGLLVLVGALIGGPQTALLFLGIALVFNLVMFFFSDKIALKMSRARPFSEDEAPGIYSTVRELCEKAQLPMPRLYLIPEPQPNAFATGRSPSHSAVALTEGLLRNLSEAEVRGVIAHELAHIKNRDTLTQTLAAAIGSAITYLGYMLMWGGDDSPLGALGAIAMVLLAPLAASIIQLAISRQREYSADATGAELSGNPEGLASALLRLEQAAEAEPMHVNQATEALYIVKPFSGRGMAALFSTHPPIDERVRRLRQMRTSLG